MTLMRAEVQPVPVLSKVERTSTLERLRHQSLNLTPPQGLLEDLEEIPEKISELVKKFGDAEGSVKQSTYDLSAFQSILIPTSKDESDVKMDPGVLSVRSIN